MAGKIHEPAIAVDPTMTVESVIQRLVASPNVCDQRKGRDIGMLQELGQRAWAGRLAPMGIHPGPGGRSFFVVGRLRTAGLAWRNGEPQQNSIWTMALEVQASYPLVMPGCVFVGQENPYNPHVTHRSFIPDAAGLPPVLQQYLRTLREGGRDGVCCYARSTEWKSDASHHLALIVWQCSRILCGARLWGERGSLNNDARDYYLRLGREGKLPLGPALPYENVFGDRPAGPAGLNAGPAGLPIAKDTHAGTPEVKLGETLGQEESAGADDDMEWKDDSAKDRRQ